MNHPFRRLWGAARRHAEVMAALYLTTQRLDRLEQQGAETMATIDELVTAVNGAVEAMTTAADFIRTHPATNDDPRLAEMATRLSAAAAALNGTDSTTAPTA